MMSIFEFRTRKKKTARSAPFSRREALSVLSGCLGLSTSVNANTAEISASSLDVSTFRAGNSAARFIANVIRPKDYGAVGDGVADDTSAIQASLTAASEGHGIIEFGACIYRVTRRLIVKPGPSGMYVRGVSSASTLLLSHMQHGLEVVGDLGTSKGVVIRNLRIERQHVELPVVQIGPKSLYIFGIDGVKVSEVEEVGSIGFGIHLDRCSNFLIRACHVHDHVSGSQPKAGTDGIHASNCWNGEIVGNYIHDVGDDGLSVGSFMGVPNSHQTENIVIKGNKLKNVTGSIKVYGSSSNILIEENECTNCANGGITIWDDRNKEESYDIYDVKIINNLLVKCGGYSASGGVYIAQTRGNSNCSIHDISISRNMIIECHYGVTAACSADGKSIKNIFITLNELKSCQKYNFYLINVDGPVIIEGNVVDASKKNVRIFPPTLPPSYKLDVPRDQITFGR